MPIQGIEWIIVAVIVLVLFLWGPEKLPKLAKSIGQAKKEFEKASKGVEEEVKQFERDLKSPTPSTPSTTYMPPPSPPSDDKLLEIARSLGIQTEGKTRDQIAQEIIEKTKKKEVAS
ncbi:MAG: twin-arginine translocase TatA/TatE family subunit [Aigarchaeota archaeon]|nr:twin-arginine translocase TatA/TatE family subunit [Aigarchaeota archaeon]MCX8192519.1 twin-arginine translocase TatA/TatE family subunit [Nitrososphaeria archaeon]MDW7985745.1 twin-arginine translocase TatA/TatE family subunit [Nitrososphaerota archaeon]